MKQPTRTHDMPPLERTVKALAAYDAFDATFDAEGPGDTVLAQFTKLESLAEAVGYAFGLDTADRNSPETCRQVIRPGHKVPGPGYELSFVRRMVALYEQRTISGN